MSRRLTWPPELVRGGFSRHELLLTPTDHAYIEELAAHYCPTLEPEEWPLTQLVRLSLAHEVRRLRELAKPAGAAAP